ncbi:MAG TPA: ABC transporter permease [Actinomycetota bacterium]|nr:ABC transporter permease [Actinomycetota bacterium]
MAKLFVASVKMLYRDRLTVFWALMFPVIFAVVFGLFDFDRAPEVRIDMVGEPSAPMYRALQAGLGRIASFELHRAPDLGAARSRLADGETDVVVVVPSTLPGPGASLDVPVLYNGANADVNTFALSAIERIAGATNLRLAGVEPPPLEVRPRAVEGKTIDFYDFLLPGLVAMGVMNYSIVGMGVAVARFREQRILRRILATPLAPWRFIAAQVAARLLLALVQAALITATGVFLFGARIYGNVGWLFALAALGNLVFLNIGFAVAGRAPNPDAAAGVGNVVALPMMFLSGVFFPTDTLPAVMQRVVEFLPLTPLLEAMRKVVLEGLPISSTGSQLLRLAAWTVVSFLLASRLFRFSEAR